MTENEAKGTIAADVSRETLERLDAYVHTLHRWQEKVNLVANTTLPATWSRHIFDSVQLLHLVPKSTALWLDLGSGGGLPAIPCAICARDFGIEAHFHLVESDTRKCAFLREAARVTGTEITLHNTRIEELDSVGADIVTARALAPLPKLLGLAHPHLGSNGICLLQKGAAYTSELESARTDWQMNVEVLPSQTAKDAVILRIRNLAHG